MEVFSHSFELHCLIQLRTLVLHNFPFADWDRAERRGFGNQEREMRPGVF
jgi:hypothetical protein